MFLWISIFFFLLVKVICQTLNQKNEVYRRQSEHSPRTIRKCSWRYFLLYISLLKVLFHYVYQHERTLPSTQFGNLKLPFFSFLCPLRLQRFFTKVNPKSFYLLAFYLNLRNVSFFGWLSRICIFRWRSSISHRIWWKFNEKMLIPWELEEKYLFHYEIWFPWTFFTLSARQNLIFLRYLKKKRNISLTWYIEILLIHSDGVRWSEPDTALSYEISTR